MAASTLHCVGRCVLQAGAAGTNRQQDVRLTYTTPPGTCSCDCWIPLLCRTTVISGRLKQAPCQQILLNTNNVANTRSFSASFRRVCFDKIKTKPQICKWELWRTWSDRGRCRILDKQLLGVARRFAKSQSQFLNTTKMSKLSGLLNAHSFDGLRLRFAVTFRVFRRRV